MKKLIAFLLVLAMITAFSGCGVNEEHPTEPTKGKEEMPSEPTAGTEEPPSEPTEGQQEPPTEPTEGKEEVVAVIEAKNCYGDAGYILFLAGAESSGEYTFVAENSEAVNWCVYILSEKFEDAYRYIKQAAEQTLEGDGTIFIEEGKYVYVYCSANEFTTGIRDENAKLKVTME